MILQALGGAHPLTVVAGDQVELVPDGAQAVVGHVYKVRKETSLQGETEGSPVAGESPWRGSFMASPSLAGADAESPASPARTEEEDTRSETTEWATATGFGTVPGGETGRQWGIPALETPKTESQGEGKEDGRTQRTVAAEPVGPDGPGLAVKTCWTVIPGRHLFGPGCVSFLVLPLLLVFARFFSSNACLCVCVCRCVCVCVCVARFLFLAARRRSLSVGPSLRGASAESVVAAAAAAAATAAAAAAAPAAAGAVVAPLTCPPTGQLVPFFLLFFLLAFRSSDCFFVDFIIPGVSLSRNFADERYRHWFWFWVFFRVGLVP